MPAWNVLAGPENVWINHMRGESGVNQPYEQTKQKRGEITWKRGRGVSSVGSFFINYLGLRSTHQIYEIKIAERKDQNF